MINADKTNINAIITFFLLDILLSLQSGKFIKFVKQKIRESPRIRKVESGMKFYELLTL